MRPTVLKILFFFFFFILFQTIENLKLEQHKEESTKMGQSSSLQFLVPLNPTQWINNNKNSDGKHIDQTHQIKSKQKMNIVASVIAFTSILIFLSVFPPFSFFFLC